MLKFFSIFLALVTLHAGAQERIEGYYNASRQSFYPKVNLTSGRTVYSIRPFSNNVALISDESGMQGLIDTNGILLIAIRYKKLDDLNHSLRNHFVFNRADTSGVVTRYGEELFAISALPDTASPANKPTCDWRSRHGVFITPTANADFCILKARNRVRLFCLSKKKFLTPHDFNCVEHLEEECWYSHDGRLDVKLEKHVALFYTGEGRVVVDLETGKESDIYTSIRELSSGACVVVTKGGEMKVFADIFNPASVWPVNAIDAYDEYILFRSAGMMGMLNAQQKTVIPALYDDIYFMSPTQVWVKKGGRWALSSINHELKTQFDYLNIDKLNRQFLDGVQYITRLDTSESVLRTRKEVGMGNNVNRVKTLYMAVQELEGTRRLFTTYKYRAGSQLYAFVQKDDGFHLFYVPLSNESPEAWDRIFLIPFWVDGVNSVEGFQKGKMYGFSQKKLKYQGLFYDAMQANYGFREAQIRGAYIWFQRYGNPYVSPPQEGRWYKWKRVDEFLLR